MLETHLGDDEFLMVSFSKEGHEEYSRGVEYGPLTIRTGLGRFLGLHAFRSFFVGEPPALVGKKWLRSLFIVP